MSKKDVEKPQENQSLEATLIRLAQPKMTPKELLKAARRQHPEASKKEIVRAAFHSLIAIADSDADKALILQDFALKGRGTDEN